MTTSQNMNAAAIALNRFGLGARADDSPPADPKGWLLAQLEQYQPRPAAWASQPDSVALSTELAQQRMQLNQLNRQDQQNTESAERQRRRGRQSDECAGRHANQRASQYPIYWPRYTQKPPHKLLSKPNERRCAVRSWTCTVPR